MLFCLSDILIFNKYISALNGGGIIILSLYRNE
jgi:hypothetical protein